MRANSIASDLQQLIPEASFIESMHSVSAARAVLLDQEVV